LPASLSILVWAQGVETCFCMQKFSNSLPIRVTKKACVGWQRADCLLHSDSINMIGLTLTHQDSRKTQLTSRKTRGLTFNK
jgi:hypothetical protein